MNKTEFLKGRISVPRPLVADAYTVAGEALVSSKGKQKSVYNYTNRYSPAKTFPDVALDSRTVFYGLTEYVREHLTKPITREEVDLAVEFMASAHSFGGGLKFDPKPWYRVIDEFGGYMPLKIEALPEGSTCFPNEPLIQVTSLGEGFGEMAAHVEAVLLGMVSIASTRVTLERHWLERIKEWCVEDKNLPVAQYMIHDFGMRASSCAEESELLGKAHLLVFHGTDTFNAAYQARKLGAHPQTGTSILALAHRIVQSYSNEKDSYTNLLSQDKIGSYVADCYNYKKAVTDILVGLAKDNPDKTIVARPDSGDYLENDWFVQNTALQNGLVEALDDETFTKYGPKNLTSINGDSMTPRKVESIFRQRLTNGFSPTRWGIFGVGGYLRNNVSRDSLSSAYKLSSIGTDNEPVIKLSDSLGKMSVPGPVNLRRYADCDDRERIRQTVFLESEYHAFGEPAYVVYYDASKEKVEDKFGDVVTEAFSKIQDRTIENFDRYANVLKEHPDFGLPSCSCLSKNIVEMQQSMLKKYR